MKPNATMPEQLRRIADEKLERGSLEWSELHRISGYIEGLEEGLEIGRQLKTPWGSTLLDTGRTRSDRPNYSNPPRSVADHAKRLRGLPSESALLAQLREAFPSPVGEGQPGAPEGYWYGSAHADVVQIVRSEHLTFEQAEGFVRLRLALERAAERERYNDSSQNRLDE